MDAGLLPLMAFALAFLAAIPAPWLVARLKDKAAWLLALFPAAIFCILGSHVDDIAGGAVFTAGFDWAPSLGLRFSWRLDGLSLTFGLLISGIGALIVLYSGSYLKDDPGQGRFFVYLFLFTGSMLGLVLSDNLLMLFVFWEMTSITSFLLIGYHEKSQASRRAAFQALAVTGGGGLALLAGLLWLSALTGINDFSGLLAKAPGISSGHFVAPMVLILIGAFTKSAQFPFYFWLPNAMQAPTPVSAFLHSATMVKAGVYLLMRLQPVFGTMEEWQVILPVFGAITLLVGAVLSIRQTDLKLMLAYSTVASLGLLVMLTGLSSERAIEAAVIYLVAHALFKGALFMIAGIIDHATGSRDITRLGGLGRKMPWTFFAGLLAALSMGGLPFFLGFQAKEEIYASLTGPGTILLLVVVVCGNGLMFAIAFGVGLKPFIGTTSDTAQKAHDGPLLLMIGPIILALAGLVAGLFSTQTHWFFTSPMASSVWGQRVDIDLALLPHWGLPLALSGVTIGLGIVIYRLQRPLAAMLAFVEARIGWGPDRGFDQGMAWLIRFGARLSRQIQPGRLEIYMTITFIVVAVTLLAAPAWWGEWPSLPQAWPQLRLYEWAFLAIVLLGLYPVIAAKTKVMAIVSLGIQGFGVAVLYLLFGAPDLSFTQFMIETLSVVILALVMTRLRLGPTDPRPFWSKIGDGAIALACGLGFASLLLKAVETPFDRNLTDFFSEFSKTVAHGTNVVNVIIVDFRGTDTLGEIAVVAIAGLAILALIRLRPPKLQPANNDPDREEENNR